MLSPLSQRKSERKKRKLPHLPISTPPEDVCVRLVYASPPDLPPPKFAVPAHHESVTAPFAQMLKMLCAPEFFAQYQVNPQNIMLCSTTVPQTPSVERLSSSITATIQNPLRSAGSRRARL